LRDVLDLKPFQLGLVLLIVNFAVDIAMALANGVLFTPPGAPFPGLLQDPTAIFFDLVIVPVIPALYLWSAPGAQRVWKELNRSELISDKAVIRSEHRRSLRRYASPWFFWLTVIVSLALTVAQIAAHMDWVPWQTISGWLFNVPAMSLGRAPFWFVLFYSVLFGAWNMLVTFTALNRVFRQVDVKYQPLHPDGSSGLAWVGAFIVTSAIAIAPLGLGISVSVITEVRAGTLMAAPPVVVMLAAYLVLAPILLVWPAWAAHRALVRARYDRLLALAGDHEQVAARLHRSKTDETDSAIDDRLATIQHLYDTVAKGPTWPFDIQVLRRFGTLYLGSVLPAVISLVLERIGLGVLGP
jgi:hypothetical protein